LDEDEIAVTRDLGLAIWIVTVKKRGRSGGKASRGFARKRVKSRKPH
jgi:hypothetical protein